MSNDTNECSFESVDDYDQRYNIAAIFIILVTSMMGTLLPILAKRNPTWICFRSPFVFTIGKHVGTGVIIALALIHLLTPAYEALGNPCLPAAFAEDYTFAPLFAMLGALVMHLFETLASMRDLKTALKSETSQPGMVQVSASDSDPERGQNSSCTATATPDSLLFAHGHSHGGLLGNSSAERTIGAYVLEFGLTAHSVIIGLTVGVSSVTDLETLIPALVFHQFFEGIALGARLVECNFSKLNEFLLAFIYSVSAPVGIAIGIGIVNSYNENGVTTNLVQGTFDAVSAGILLYVGFTQMLAIEFPRDFAAASSRARRVALFVAMWVGAGIMAFIGRYL
ncbi:ZIP zinc transporter [Capsaspora owczarzaki ATCC 30864]|uniref:ZIP zinc transporter n=1 Tax=Capsaspora owczarzaki (strain ATCC 30864) TaxID=595528 RepID=E9CH47_CAPO3|nr:ZIP zinc transporter [Capsaspora owczarzaki ATCC 30864]XP_004343396.1 ZIP zinc transporter [Capsaspora owczarzaki ATCC 30864]KJE97014.1 ZIP zinc transporter [Capsaspora owczarzaki ATCC 30864]KJE97036.1 ZIP zinc transporter [Capsaspora owczarzaki ATCC 30864]|eukprot:XP_004343375.2 ZIP zinc transporter [Capsaspora owczarzaki ATCC 30864]